MKTPVMLSLRSTQRYGEQEAEVLELTTEGTMEFRDGGWDISYRESALTGLFRQGDSHDSLYEMPFGALLMTVETSLLFYDIVPDGGTIDLCYRVIIENAQAGDVEYHLDIRAK